MLYLNNNTYKRKIRTINTLSNKENQTGRSSPPSAANNNDFEFTEAQNFPSTNASKWPDSGVRVCTDFPDQISVLEGELNLIETYFPDLIVTALANDNDAQDRM
jgi:hypothetical protein